MSGIADITKYTHTHTSTHNYLRTHTLFNLCYRAKTLSNLQNQLKLRASIDIKCVLLNVLKNKLINKSDSHDKSIKT